MASAAAAAHFPRRFLLLRPQLLRLRLRLLLCLPPSPPSPTPPSRPRAPRTTTPTKTTKSATCPRPCAAEGESSPPGRCLLLLLPPLPLLCRRKEWRRPLRPPRLRLRLLRPLPAPSTSRPSPRSRPLPHRRCPRKRQRRWRRRSRRQTTAARGPLAAAAAAAELLLLLLFRPLTRPISKTTPTPATLAALLRTKTTTQTTKTI